MIAWLRTAQKNRLALRFGRIRHCDAESLALAPKSLRWRALSATLHAVSLMPAKPKSKSTDGGGNGGKARADISIFGQESNSTTSKLAKLH
ncbi:MAG TPA: hypothetical protein VF982_04795 [Anaerolineales bacterium]